MKVSRQNTTNASPRRSGLSGLIIAVVMIGIGVGATFAVFGGVLDNLDAMTGGNKVIIESVNTYTDGDRLVISGNMKNIGTAALTSVLIDEISVGELTITQNAYTEDGVVVDNHGDMTISGVTDTGAATATSVVDYDDTVVASTTTDTTDTLVWTAITTAGDADKFYFLDTTTTSRGVAHVSLTGLSTSESNQVSLPAGMSKSFRIVVTGISAGGHADVLDILRSVPASSDLFMTVAGTTGSSSTISDVRTVSVKQRCSSIFSHTRPLGRSRMIGGAVLHGHRHHGDASNSSTFSVFTVRIHCI